MLQTQKWVNLSLLVAGFVFFLFFYKLLAFGWDLARFPQPEEWPIEPVAIIDFVVSLATLLALRRNERVNTFLNEVVMELSKVTWPLRKETVLSTGVVAVMVAVCSLILFAFDFMWGTITRGLLSY